MTKFLMTLAAFALISTAAIAAPKTAATDEKGGTIRATNGTCVRTKWNDSKDICAPAPKVEEAPVAAPAPVVEKAPEPKVKLAKELGKEEKTVYFEFNKANILADEQAKLDSLANVLLSDKEVDSVKIVAYADKMGSTDYNDKLSQKRATAVNDYLNAKGYLKTTVAETAWLGESAPKTECPDKMKRTAKIKCLQEDRRAEIVINYSQTVTVPADAPTTPVAPDAAEPKSGTPAVTTPAQAAPTAPAEVIAPAPESKTETPADKPNTELKFQDLF